MTDIRRIKPDYIKESIVEIRYTNSFPASLIPGMVFNVLKNDFSYSHYDESLPIPSLIQQKGNINFSINKEGYFYNDLITLKIRPDSIIFNSNEQYPLWEEYYPLIKKALSGIYHSGVIGSFDRIGIRYINEYPEKDLSNIVNFTFGFNMPKVKSNSYSLRSDFEYNEHRIILNLSDGVDINVIDEHGKNKLVKAAYVDVDVINDKIKTDSLEDFFEAIDSAHSVEKDIFFNILLTKKFLDSLEKIQRHGNNS